MKKEINIFYSGVFEKTLEASSRIIVHEGSSRSSKTYSVIQYLIYQAIQKKLSITICRARLTWLKATAMMDFFEILKNYFDMYDQRDHNKTDHIYKLYGSMFRFVGLDEVQKLHGLKSDIVWINESMECDYADFQQLALRCTGQIIVDYNPCAETHWIYDKVIPRDDCTFIKSTYKDNPFLEKEVVDEIERMEPTEHNIKQGTADETNWKIYGLGERASHQGLIFSHAKIVKELPPKELWKKSFYGLDFGYTHDPTCLCLVVLSQGDLYLKEIFYKRKLTNLKNLTSPNGNSIQEQLELHGISKTAMIWADSAEPKSIEEISMCGYQILGAPKGPDSIRNGIDLLLSYNLNITEDSVNAIKEKNNYKWERDRSTGELTSRPVAAFDHFWDGIRYAAMAELNFSRHDPYKARQEENMPLKLGVLDESINHEVASKRKTKTKSKEWFDG